MQCDSCKKWARSFKFMLSVKVVEQTEEFLGDVPDKTIFKRTCAPCLAEEKGESLGSAITDICDQRVRHARDRCQKYESAKVQIQQRRKFVEHIVGDNPSKRLIKVLSRTDFVKIFAPWASLIALKKASMDAAVGFVKDLDKKMVELKVMFEQNASPQTINEHMRYIDEMEKHIAETSKALAWRSKGDAQDKYLVICEYADEWICYAGYRIRSYYVCVCGVLVASKLWPRLHKEIDSTGQRWYCPRCVRRYRPGFGQIVEILTPDATVLYARAPLPPKDIEDLRAMDLEEKCHEVKTPMELWEHIRSYEPASGNDIVRAATDNDLGCDFKTKPDAEKELVRKSMAVLTAKGTDALRDLPKFDWRQIINFA